MKKLILSLTLVAFALVPALQAGEGKESADAKKACCATTCCEKKAVAKKTDLSIKGAQLLVSR
jgi:hypothetical protein